MSSCHVPNPSWSHFEPKIPKPFANKRKSIKPESRHMTIFWGTYFFSFHWEMALRFAVQNLNMTWTQITMDLILVKSCLSIITRNLAFWMHCIPIIKYWSKSRFFVTACFMASIDKTVRWVLTRWYGPETYINPVNLFSHFSCV